MASLISERLGKFAGYLAYNVTSGARNFAAGAYQSFSSRLAPAPEQPASSLSEKVGNCAGAAAYTAAAVTTAVATNFALGLCKGVASALPARQENPAPAAPASQPPPPIEVEEEEQIEEEEAEEGLDFSEELTEFVDNLVTYLSMSNIYETRMGNSSIPAALYNQFIYGPEGKIEDPEKRKQLFFEFVNERGGLEGTAGRFKEFWLKHVSYPWIHYLLEHILTDFSEKLEEKVTHFLENDKIETYAQRRLRLLLQFVADLQKNVKKVAQDPDKIAGADPQAKLQHLFECPEDAGDPREVEVAFDEILVSLGNILVEDFNLKLHFVQDLIKKIHKTISSKNPLLDALCLIGKLILACVLVIPFLFLWIVQELINKFYIKASMKEYIQKPLKWVFDALSEAEDSLGYTYEMDKLVWKLLGVVLDAIKEEDEPAAPQNAPGARQAQLLSKEREKLLRSTTSAIYDIAPSLTEESMQDNTHFKAVSGSFVSRLFTSPLSAIDPRSTLVRPEAIKAGQKGLQAVLHKYAKNDEVEPQFASLLNRLNKNYKMQNPIREEAKIEMKEKREKRRRQLVKQIASKAGLAPANIFLEKTLNDRIEGLGNFISMKDISWKFGLVYLVVKPYLEDHGVQIGTKSKK